ncbi:MAG: inositol monophosphatase family protein [Flavobacterium sp.]
MTEFQIALKKILEINEQLLITIKEHDDKHSIVRKCEQISYNQLKSIPLETELPFISKYDQPSFEERKNWDSFWIVSPIIGKKNLREGKNDFLVGITKIQHKRPSFAIISAPQKKALFIGFNNKAYKIENIDLSLKVGIDELLTDNHLIRTPTEGFFFTLMKSSCLMNIKTEKFFDDFKLYKSGSIKEVIDESPMNLIGIAEGTYDFHPHLKSINEWDIAPFDALITASGNRVTQKDGILPLTYNNKTLKIAAFIAKNNFDIDSIDLKK